MQRAIKTFAGLLGLVIVFCLASMVAIVLFINPNDFKPQISQQVYKYTGRQLTLNGAIHWSFFPWLGLQLNEAQLSNAAGFGAQPFAQIQQADISVKLLPLLHKHLEIGKLTLVGLDLNLTQNKQGVSNWQDLLKPAAQPNDPPASKTADPQKTTGTNSAQPLTMAIANIDVTNGHITWNDQQKNQQYVLNNLQMHSKNIKLGQAFPLDMQFNLQNPQTKLNTDLQINTQITADTVQKTYLLQQFKLNGQLNDKSYSNGKLPITLQGDISANLANGTFSIAKLAATVANLDIQGALNGTQLITSPAMQGHLQIPTFNLNQFMAAMGNASAQKPNPLLQQTSAEFDLVSTANNYKLNNLVLHCGAITATGNINADTRGQTPVVTTNLQTNGVQIEPLFDQFASTSRLKFSGVGNFSTRLSMQTGANLLSSTNGQGNISVNNGILKGINIPYWVSVGKALVNKQTPPAQSGPNQTDFGTMTGSYTITNGLLRNNDLVMHATNFQATGQGTINLVNQSIDYTLNVVLPNAGSGVGTIPLLITGSLSDVHVKPDMQAIIKSAIKGQIKDQINNLLKKNVPGNVGGVLQQQLNNLLK